jgi:hypothetical protein
MTDTKRDEHTLGERRPITFARQLMIDLMAFSRSIPLIALERSMSLKSVAEAREGCPERPPWSGIFAKAFGLVAQEMRPLRRAYITAPIPYIFEYDETAVTIAHEVELEGDRTVLPVRISGPEKWPLAGFRFKLDEIDHPNVWDSHFFRNLRRMGYLPWPLRRLVWWSVLNIPRLRKRCFGTFVITSVGELGADCLNPRSPVSPLLTYGPIDGHGMVTVRLLFDHRLFDAATAARALARLEEILTGRIQDELRQG